MFCFIRSVAIRISGRCWRTCSFIDCEQKINKTLSDSELFTGCNASTSVYIWSMWFDSKWTSYSCSMILAHSWKLLFCLHVQHSFDWYKCCFPSFLPVFSILNWAKTQHFIHFGERNYGVCFSGTRRRYKCLQLSHWNMVATANHHRVVQVTLDVGEAD